MTNGSPEAHATAPAVPAAGEAEAERFAARLRGHLNGAALALLVSVGHRTGLFDVLAGQEPSTSYEIAGRAGLDERYVREWLAALAAGGVLDLDAGGSRYRLPPAHAACLTRAAPRRNLAVAAQVVAPLAAVEDRLVACFRDGGGIPPEAFPHYAEIAAEDAGRTLLPDLVDAVLPLVADLPARLDRGADVLDVGGGRARALLLLAETFPRSRFVGYDLDPEAVAHARRRAARKGLRNVRFEIQDAGSMTEREGFDLVTAFDAIHAQARPLVVLERIHRALRPAGAFLMQEARVASHVRDNLDHPLGPLLYTLSCVHDLAVSLARGGAGTGRTWGRETALRMLAAAGFTDVRVENLPHDVEHSWFVATV